MKEKERDILAEEKRLREMPFSVPEGYFEAFKAEMDTFEGKEPGLFRRLVPYMAMAAAFLFLVTGGTFLLQHTIPEEDFTQEDFLVFSSGISNYEYYEEMEHIADADIEDEDIIEYLIYSGISAEEIEFSK